MNKKLKAKWVKALESGKYKQCKNELAQYDGRGYCCLGVLGRMKGIPRKNMAGASYLSADCHFEPFPLATEETLMKMNDDQGKTFKEIAKWIRSHL